MYQPDKLDVLPVVQPEVDEVGQVLLKAADLIRTKGHVKHTQRDAYGRMCVHGAISIAMNGRPGGGGRFPAEIRLAKFLAGRGAPDIWSSDGYGNSAIWNNHPDRTADEVIKALEDAAVYRP